MSIFKCKMCGGDLEIAEGASVAECQYCGSKQTLPRFDSERKTNLYDRANHFRRNNEFDKAEGIYENILNEDPTDAEAYWSLVLCRYGIEYVEDPATHKRVPTVNRAQYTSVFADENYKKAVECADALQRELYEAEAKAIDDIQRGILEISEKEEPFDVFICYKETDAQGRRTPDSVLANELYHELTKEGFKVFFSRITLEDKLGTAYEPYIFAALNSARVMVVLGTKPEYFNAVWVKNEWSRYLALIRSGAKKSLIPAYRDMDPYDLPEEFSHLQAQDMSKLGFMPDLIRGVKKLLAKDEPSPVKETVAQQAAEPSVGGANLTAQLKRGVQALEDRDWTAADGFFDKALDMDAECAEAFFGKTLAEEKCSSAEELIQKRLNIPVKTAEVMTACERDSERVERAIKEYTIPGYLDEKTIRSYYSYDERSYDSLTKAWQNRMKDEETYWSTSRTLSRAVRFAKDPLAAKLKEIRSKIDESLKGKLAKSELSDQQAAQQTRERYAQRIDKAEAALVKEYAEKSNARKAEYDRVCQMQKSAKTVNDYEEAARLFESVRLHGYEDSDERAEQCQEKAEQIKVASLKAVRAKKRKNTIIICAVTLVVITIGVSLFMSQVVIPKRNKYQTAEAMLAAGDYEAAIIAFSELAQNSYKDSYERLKDAIAASYRERWPDVKIGDFIRFGYYEQDNNNSNGKEEIEWLVLDKDGNNILVVSKYALFCEPFDASYKKTYYKNDSRVTWKASPLRRTLNNGFLNTAFSSKEQMLIPRVTVSDDDTIDQVFLLSETEVRRYFASDEAQSCKPTAYAKAQGCDVSSWGDYCTWWLRSPGIYSYELSIVSYGGGVLGIGECDEEDRGVRPALWIYLGSENN